MGTKWEGVERQSCSISTRKFFGTGHLTRKSSTPGVFFRKIHTRGVNTGIGGGGRRGGVKKNDSLSGTSEKSCFQAENVGGRGVNIRNLRVNQRRLLYGLVFPFAFVIYEMPPIIAKYNMTLGYVNDATNQVTLLHFILCGILCVFFRHWRPESRSWARFIERAASATKNLVIIRVRRNARYDYHRRDRQGQRNTSYFGIYVLNLFYSHELYFAQHQNVCVITKLKS